MSVVIKELAFIKIILHASRYPHSSVNGILLSPKNLENSKENLVICNAIPLFHHSITLTSMLEVALNHIESYCKKENLCISGYYQINEYVDKNSPTPIAYRIADKIYENNENSCLLMVKNDELGNENPCNALCIYRCHDNRWKESVNAPIIDDTASEKTEHLLKVRAQRALVDFDSHLDDISLSWPNDPISSLLEKNFNLISK